MQAVVEAAGVSRGDFYRSFDGVADCISATHAQAAAGLLAFIDDARRTESGDDPGATATAAAVCRFLADEVELAWVLTDPALASIPEVAEARVKLDERLATLLSCSRIPTEDVPHLIRGTQGWVSSCLAARTPERLVVEAEALAALVATSTGDGCNNKHL